MAPSLESNPTLSYSNMPSSTTSFLTNMETALGTDTVTRISTSTIDVNGSNEAISPGNTLEIGLFLT